MTDARGIISNALARAKHDDHPDWTGFIMNQLDRAGFRVLGPDEVDAVTVERAAAWHDHNAEMLENDDSPYSAWHKGAAAAIRALGRKA